MQHQCFFQGRERNNDRGQGCHFPHVLQFVEEQDRQLDPDFFKRLALPPIPKEEKRLLT